MGKSLQFSQINFQIDASLDAAPHTTICQYSDEKKDEVVFSVGALLLPDFCRFIFILYKINWNQWNSNNNNNILKCDNDVTQRE